MSVPRHRCRLEIFPDYHQFYVWDPEKSGQQAPVDWTDQDVAHRAKIAPGVVVVCPLRNNKVPVEIGIWDTEPHVIFNNWQHIVEAPLRTRGTIEIHESTGESLACFTVEEGDYTVRVLFGGLNTISADGFEGNDFYEIQIWKEACDGLKLIRIF